MLMRFSLLGLWAAAIAGVAPSSSQAAYHLAAQLPAGDGGWDIVSVDPVDQRLYIGRPDGVTAIDLGTGKATDRLVPGKRVHAALAIPGTHEVISTNGDSNTALLFDGRTGRIRAAMPTGTKPDAAAYDPATRTLWIMDPAGRDGNLSIIRLSPTPMVIAQIPTAVSARTIGLDPVTGRAYLPAATLAPAPAGERPKPVPGTFRVLVIAP